MNTKLSLTIAFLLLTNVICMTQGRETPAHGAESGSKISIPALCVLSSCGTIVNSWDCYCCAAKKGGPCYDEQKECQAKCQ